MPGMKALRKSISAASGLMPWLLWIGCGLRACGACQLSHRGWTPGNRAECHGCGLFPLTFPLYQILIIVRQTTSTDFGSKRYPFQSALPVDCIGCKTTFSTAKLMTDRRQSRLALSHVSRSLSISFMTFVIRAWVYLAS